METQLTDQEIKDGFTLTKWKGEYNNYECVHSTNDGLARCAYATLWEGKMRDHLASGNHPWGRPDGAFIPSNTPLSVSEPLSDY